MTAMEYIRVTRPDPNEAFPNPNLPRLCFIKNVVKNPRIIIGDYTYWKR
jgi:virginiamycin A acetyltransferase